MEEEILYCSPSKIVETKIQKRKLCIYEGCATRPSFNFEGESKGLYCFQHKLFGMINIINKQFKVKPFF